MYRDRLEYHTDGTLQILRKVQGTDRNITLTEHYGCLEMYRDQKEYHTDGTLHMLGKIPYFLKYF